MNLETILEHLKPLVDFEVEINEDEIVPCGENEFDIEVAHELDDIFSKQGFLLDDLYESYHHYVMTLMNKDRLHISICPEFRSIGYRG